jgi:alginate O-acetyltransferase complex protein AlgI
MIFNSLTYLTFLLITVIFYWLSPNKIRVFLICLSSLIFYGFWHPEFLLIMVTAAGIDYYLALKISTVKDFTRKKSLLVFSLAINLGLLCYFKYLFFVIDNMSVVLNAFDIEFQAPALNIILPLAISFYTFEAISYVVDVYRRETPPEKNFLLYLCFITFFPKLIAGPILRASEIIPQISHKIHFNSTLFVSGIHRIIVGLFLKVVVADNIAPLVEAGFNIPTKDLSAIDIWTLAFLFGFQIYFDFSAYSSIAIGSARLFGIQIPENFNFPYVATTPKEFWKRWHISLSTWIRDYLYIPLQKIILKNHETLNSKNNDKSSTTKLYLILFVTWGIMGLWHGANWNFLIWGIYHASLITLYRLIFKIKLLAFIFKKSYVSWGLTLPLIMLGWIPFRSLSTEETLNMWIKVFSLENYFWLGMRENTYLVTAIIFVLFIFSSLLNSLKINVLIKITSTTFLFQIIFYSLTLFFVIVFLRPINQYIYFQF